LRRRGSLLPLKHLVTASIQTGLEPLKPFPRPCIRAYIDPAINQAADNGAGGFAGQ
jgi:hypothetical protein